jgi:hypothetical protein
VMCGWLRLKSDVFQLFSSVQFLETTPVYRILDSFVS